MYVHQLNYVIIKVVGLHFGVIHITFMRQQILTICVVQVFDEVQSVLGGSQQGLLVTVTQRPTLNRREVILQNSQSSFKQVCLTRGI